MMEIPKFMDAAVQMHEMFVSFVDAGFSEEQALELTIRVTLGAVSSGPEA